MGGRNNEAPIIPRRQHDVGQRDLLNRSELVINHHHVAHTNRVCKRDLQTRERIRQRILRRNACDQRNHTGRRQNRTHRYSSRWECQNHRYRAQNHDNQLHDSAQHLSLSSKTARARCLLTMLRDVLNDVRTGVTHPTDHHDCDNQQRVLQGRNPCSRIRWEHLHHVIQANPRACHQEQCEERDLHTSCKPSEVIGLSRYHPQRGPRQHRYHQRNQHTNCHTRE